MNAKVKPKVRVKLQIRKFADQESYEKDRPFEIRDREYQDGKPITPLKVETPHASH